MLWDPLELWPRWRTPLWGLLAIFTLVTQGPHFVSNLRPAEGDGVDLFQDWASARNFLEGLPIYTPHSVTIPRYLGHTAIPIDPQTVSHPITVQPDLRSHSANNQQTPTVVKIELDYNAHPPSSVLLVLPVAPLEYANAVLVWNLVSLTALAWSGWLILRGLNIPLTCWSVFPILAITLQCSPLQQQVAQGQLNGVLLLLFTGVWWADRTKHPVWAGVAVGVAAAIKLFPAFLLLHFALRRQWRTVVSGGLSLLAVTAATALLFGVDCFQTFLHKILPYTAALRSRWTNSSLIGWSTKLFNPASLQEQVEPWIRSPWLEMGVSALLCGAVLVLWMPAAWRASHRESQDRAFGLTLTAMLLVSPITWDHYFLLLLLPIVLTWKGLSESMAERWWFVATVFALCVSPSVLWTAFIRDGQLGVAGPVQSLTALSVHLYALLILFWLQARRRSPINAHLSDKDSEVSS